jgi:lipopolysaccharide transport system permease protein
MLFPNFSFAGAREGLRLAWMLSKRDLKNRYANSYMGAAWTVGVPLLYSIINVIVFSILMSGRMGSHYGDIPFALFYFVPFSLWTLFTEIVGRSPGILREHSYLINKIAFPAWVLPLIPLASAFLSQSIILILTAGLMVHLNVYPAKTAGIYIFIWLIAITFSLGVAYIISAIGLFVPDLGQIVRFFITILFWLTPFLYPATLVEKNGAVWVRNIIMHYNPFYYLVEISRHAVFGSAEIGWAALSIMAIFALLTGFLGLLIFQKLRPGFADVI